jgi:uncharacterized protein (DUF1919 family)
VNIKVLNIDFEATLKWRFIDTFFSRIERSKLKNKNFSIIGNNCVTGGIYHKFNLAFSSPTIWSSFYPEEYIKFLENLNWYLKQPLEFTSTTKHLSAQIKREHTRKNYPIGLLGKDVEIHFVHCQTEQEALEKWARRTKRINFNNLFVIFSDEGQEFKEELIERFEKLPFEHKVFFSSKPRSKYKSVVFVKEYANSQCVCDSTRNRKYEKYIDLVKWLNCEENFLKKIEA